MKSIFTFTVAAALGSVMLASPSAAQKEEQPVQASIKLSKAADKPVRALNAVVLAKDAANYPAALAAAQAAAQTDQDRFLILRAQLTHSLNTKDVAGQIAALEGMLASSVMQPADRPKFYQGLAGLYKNNKNFDQAAATIEKLIALNPNDTVSLWHLAELRVDQNKPAEAIALGEQAIKIAKDSGRAVDLNWYRRVLDIAYRNKLQAQTARLARDLFAASTDAKDRRNALLIYRQYGNVDNEGRLDLLRLMRSAKVLDDPNYILSLADTLSLRHYPAEAQAVLNEAIAAGKIKANDPQVAQLLRQASGKIAEDKAVLPGLAAKAQGTGDGNLAFRVANGYFGHADYAKAAELYRLAAQKGGANQDLAKLRLGISLAMAGQNAEAQTALKSVSGDRADLAAYWLLWLSNRG